VAHGLSMTSYGLLGLLTFGDMSGYDLTKEVEGSIGYFWTPAKSQVYSELRRLAEGGYVSETRVAQETRPDKRIYSLTPVGRHALEEWLADPTLEPDSIRSVTLLKIFFGAHAPRDVLIARVKGVLAHSEETLAALREIEGQIKDQPDELFPYMTLRAGLLLGEARIRWAREVLDLLEESGDVKEGS
jgi:PadR family transcriptional regulator, regulatory protein AphA